MPNGNRTSSSRIRNLAEVAAFTALYAVLTWVFAPISYSVFQFRVAEVLKSIVVRRRHLIAAFVVGNALSNIFSPFVGPWELLWMPFINLVGASTAWFIGSHISGRKGMFIGGAIYAIWVAFGLGFMLSTLFNLPFALVFLYVLVPESILIIGFVPLMQIVDTRIGALLKHD